MIHTGWRVQVGPRDMFPHRMTLWLWLQSEITLEDAAAGSMPAWWVYRVMWCWIWAFVTEQWSKLSDSTECWWVCCAAGLRFYLLFQSLCLQFILPRHVQHHGNVMLQQLKWRIKSSCLSIGLPPTPTIQYIAFPTPCKLIFQRVEKLFNRNRKFSLDFKVLRLGKKILHWGHLWDDSRGHLYGHWSALIQIDLHTLNFPM